MLKTIVLLVWEHVRQRPIRVSLAVLGVAIGVSAWLAIRLANVEVFRAFEESVDAVVGKASIQMTGTDVGLDEHILLSIRQHPSVLAANPVLRMVGTSQHGLAQGRGVMIFGLDLLEYTNDSLPIFSGMEKTRDKLDAILDETSVFVGSVLASDWDLAPGDSIDIKVNGQSYRLVIQGLVKSSNPENRQFDKHLIMDIAAAQSLFARQGRLDHINLIIDQQYSVPQVIQDLQSLLPTDVKIARAPSRNQQVESMLKVFQFNLTVLSSVGLLVGLFLVYNTISFSVVQHRREIGILRAIGMSRLQVSQLFMTEAAAVGLVGGLVGCGLGLLMARFLVSLVGQSVTDLYASVSTGTIQLPWHMYVEGSIVGLGVSVMGAIRPCLESSGTAPVRALNPEDYEVETGMKGAHWAWVGVALFLLAGVLSLPGPVSGVPLFGYASVFFVMLGCTLLGPLAIRGLSWISARGKKTQWNVMGILAAEHIARTPGRNSVTLSALVIGLAILVGVGGMIRSFRYTVELWIDQTIMADLIVAPVSWLDHSDSAESEPELPLQFVDVIQTIPGINAVDPYRQTRVERPEGSLILVARDMSLHAEESRYLFEKGDSTEVLKQVVANKGVIVSEVLAGRLGLGVGDQLELSTPKGNRRFPILGKFYDYATDGGKVVMDHGIYRQLWNDEKSTVLAVYLAPQADLQEVRRRIENRLGAQQPVVTISHAELRKDILAIFDRTFRVTYVLEVIALCIALLGIVNTLVTAILERQRELATLRAIGASKGQIQGMVLWESGYLAALGAILGLAGGLALSVLLIKVINKQSFGWTIQLIIPPMTVLEAVCVAGLAGLLASYLPARWAVQQPIAEGLRYE